MSGATVTKTSQIKVISIGLGPQLAAPQREVIIFGHGRRTKSNNDIIDLSTSAYKDIEVNLYIREGDQFGFTQGTFNCLGTEYLKPLCTLPNDTKHTMFNYSLSNATNDNFDKNGDQKGPSSKSLALNVLRNKYDIITIRDKWVTISPITLDSVLLSAYAIGYRKFHLLHCLADEKGKGFLNNPTAKKDATGQGGIPW